MKKTSSKTYACVQCGYCCMARPCAYGVLGEDNFCKFFKKDDEELGTYKCLIYKEIKEKEKDSKYPMFDCGCSSSLFNSMRNEVIRKSGVKNAVR